MISHVNPHAALLIDVRLHLAVYLKKEGISNLYSK